MFFHARRMARAEPSGRLAAIDAGAHGTPKVAWKHPTPFQPVPDADACERASWLLELEAELFSFPGSRRDDQIDGWRLVRSTLRPVRTEIRILSAQPPSPVSPLLSCVAQESARLRACARRWRSFEPRVLNRATREREALAAADRLEIGAGDVAAFPGFGFHFHVAASRLCRSCGPSCLFSRCHLPDCPAEVRLCNRACLA